MKSGKTILLALATIGMLWAGSGARAQILIDSFQDDQDLVTTPLPAGNQIKRDVAATADAIGGFRDVTLNAYRAANGRGSVEADVNYTIPGALSLSTASNTSGLIDLVYDGGDSAGIHYTGLGGVNLEANGATKVEFDYTADHEFKLLMRFFTDATHWSQFSADVPSTGITSDIMTPYSAAFADFLPSGAAGGVDFSHVGAMEVVLDGTVVPSTDLSIANLRAAHTPEPGTWALLAAGAFSGAGLLLRRRQR